MKKYVYTLAHAANLHVEDRGDMVLLKARNGGGLQQETKITLTMSKHDITGHVQRVQG